MDGTRKLSLEERWRLDTDDRFLLHVMCEEMSKRIGLEDIEGNLMADDTIEAFVDAVRNVESQHKLRSSGPTVLKGI